MSKIVNFEGRFQKSQLKQAYQRNLLDTFSRETTRIDSITYEPSFSNEISDGDLVFGFKIYFFVTFCHENFLILWNNLDDNMELAVESEALNLYIFYSDTIDTMTPQNILQTFVNMMNSKEVMFDENTRGIEMMLEELKDVLLPSFGKILGHLFTESELDKLANSSRMTFLKTQSSDSAISPGRELYLTPRIPNSSPLLLVRHKNRHLAISREPRVVEYIRWCQNDRKNMKKNVK